MPAVPSTDPSQIQSSAAPSSSSKSRLRERPPSKSHSPKGRISSQVISPSRIGLFSGETDRGQGLVRPGPREPFAVREGAARGGRLTLTESGNPEQQAGACRAAGPENARSFLARVGAFPYNLTMRDRGGAEAGRFSSPEEDAALIRRARGGDRSAEEELVQRHYRSVFNLAYRLSNNYDDAQDIVTEAFIRVHNALPSFRGDAHFTTWLWRIVKNVFLDERKKQRIRTHSSLEEMVELEDSSVSRQIEDPNPGPVWMVERQEQADLIRRAVTSLPKNQRLMIALYHFQHRSYEEIAEIMALPIGTVKSRLNRARLALKNKLQPSRELLEN